MRLIPGLSISYLNNRVDFGRTLAASLSILIKKGRIGRQLAESLAGFRPDHALVDFEPFLPIAAKHLGIPFLSIDHQHVIPYMDLNVPSRVLPEYWAARAVIGLTHQGEQANLITSFFHPAPPHPDGTHFLAPILREEVRSLPITNRGHVLVYQTSSSFSRLPETLKELPFEFRLYAFDRIGEEGNLTFRPRGDQSFLEDVASADWVLTNGGYTLISEALFFGKPVLSVPITGQFEQWVNAHYLEKLGFGLACPTRDFRPAAVEQFVARREDFRRNLRGKDFYGNESAIRIIERFVANGSRSV